MNPLHAINAVLYGELSIVQAYKKLTETPIYQDEFVSLAISYKKEIVELLDLFYKSAKRCPARIKIALCLRSPLCPEYIIEAGLGHRHLVDECLVRLGLEALLRDQTVDSWL